MYPPRPKTGIKQWEDQCRRIRRGRLFFKYKLLQRLGIVEGVEEIMKALFGLKNKKEMTHEEQNSVNEALKDLILSQPEPFKIFLLRFFKKDIPEATYMASLRFLLQLSGDSALVAAIPVPYIDHLLSVCDALDQGFPCPKLFAKMDLYSMELKSVLQAAVQDNCLELVIPFVRFLINKIQARYSQDSIEEWTPIPGSHNPPSGTCYYFTETGDQLRKLPNYSLKVEGKGKFVYDQKPDVDGVCTKDYPYQSLGGFGYMQFFFCPLHGHCYGFHLIDGAEGRKDVFAALFKYKPTAPKEMFYDFACQLSEHCLNREPGYFLSTRFFHDIFHGFPHKCGNCFKAHRVCGLAGLDTEICEQFNSYLGCIKYTGSHLSQEHMMLLTQFMVMLWNREKTKRMNNKANVALAGMA